MEEAARPGIATHYLRYTIGNVLVMVAGFVSFPIMTRLLSNTEYGVFGYVDTWLLILTGVFKLGAQHAIIRFYPHRGGVNALGRFGANFVLLPFLCSIGFWVLATVGYGLWTWVHPLERPIIGWLCLAVLLPTIWISFVTAVLTAEERSDLSVRLSVGSRWLDAVFILLVIYFIERNALGVYAARLVSALVVTACLTIWLSRRVPLRWRDRDFAHWFAGVRYGVPMMANEFSAILLSFVDRLMLKHLLGAFAPVGIYTIGYGLALTINTLLQKALFTAFIQVSVRQFETEGPQAVVRTKRTLLHVLVYIVVAMCVGLITVGGDALLFLAGPDKAESAPVFVLIGLNYALDGLFGICFAGLLLYKRSGVVLAMTLAATVLNIVLNLFWIPAYGVMGAVYATFASFILLTVLHYITCPRELRVWPERNPTLIACVLGLLTWGVANFTGLFGLTSHLERVLAMGSLMLVLFVAPALALDRPLRTSVQAWLHNRLA
ncbi:MAG TPA: oligosaccharide flippase family protein [Rhodanobacteraceae bacterium]|nr:oligosaccharide flippase family protein [Rhodanobacteraceae bacterium]